jgi:hypothetical protein
MEKKREYLCVRLYPNFELAFLFGGFIMIIFTSLRSKFFVVLAIMCASFLSQKAHAHTPSMDFCNLNHPDSNHGKNICVKTENSFESLLHFHAEPTIETTDAVICSHSTQKLKSVELWMPSMGHGSSPTQVELLEKNCFAVSELDFFMPGKWEVRADFETEGTIAFEVQVKAK